MEVQTKPLTSPKSWGPEMKFTKEFLHDDGVKVIWKFDLEKHPNGPYQSDIIYPDSYKDSEEIEENLPKTKRKYFNKETGKEVGYTRARALGLID